MAQKRYPSGPPDEAPVYSDKLKPLEPDESDTERSRPYSLTAEELGRMPAKLAAEPIAVLAWVRYPATPMHVRGRALAWTPKAVYVEWEHRGLHRAWVWASAVQRGW